MGFDHHDPVIQEMMEIRSYIQGREHGPKSHQFNATEMRRKTYEADPTSVLDDFDESADTIYVDVPFVGIDPGVRKVGIQAYAQMHVTQVQISVGGDPWQAIRVLSATFEEAQEEFRKAMQRFSDDVERVFSPALKNLTVIISGIVDQAKEKLAAIDDVFKPVYDRDLAERRHGHAATCPRHGPTKGGFCRKCVRGRSI